MNAGAIIKAEHEQSYESGLEAPDQMQDLPPSNMDLPAGLGNIRNTCYLNSILQYLFTVRKMREIVLDWDQYGLENSEENLMARRIDPGSTRVERGEAFAGQQCKETRPRLVRDGPRLTLLQSPLSSAASSRSCRLPTGPSSSPRRDSRSRP